MKVYYKILLFISIILTIHVLLSGSFILNHEMSYPVANKKVIAFEETKDELDYMFFGNSRVKNGIDHMLFNNSFNYATKSENLYISYYRLQDIINNSDKKIKKVLFSIEIPGFYEVSIDNMRNGIYWSQFFNYYEYGLLKGNPVEWTIKGILDKHFFYSSTLKYQLEGWTTWLNTRIWKPEELKHLKYGKRNISKTIKKKIKLKDKPRDHFRDKSMHQIEKKKYNIAKKIAWKHIGEVDVSRDFVFLYINMLQKLCLESDIELIIIKMPLSKYYHKYAREFGDLLDVKQIDVDNYIKSKENILFLDFIDIYFDNDEFFKDSHHLNKKGKEAFSIMLSDTLN